MFRQSPSKSHRSKRCKTKHVMQICLLLVICFWLIYQVKHSHDKKKEFDENDKKISIINHSGIDTLKFGRKDLKTRVEVTAAKNEESKEEAENEVEEEDKHEEEEEEDKHEEGENDEKEDEERGVGDDRIDENDEDKTDGETFREEEEFIDDRKEGENEGNEKEDEEMEYQVEKQSLAEAREEQYKGDDASSAVTLESRTVGTKLNNESNNNEETSIDNNSELKIEGEMAGNGSSRGVRMATESPGSFLQNKTEIESDFSRVQKGTVESKSTGEGPVDNQFNSNITVSSKTETAGPTAPKLEGVTQNEKLGISNRFDKTSQSTDDPINSSDSSTAEEQKDVHTDVDALPEIRNEGSKNEEDLAE